MASTTTCAALAEKVSLLFKEKRLTLFAGAGVGVLAGLPDWQSYMEALAAVAGSYEPETASLMRARMKAVLYPEAAHYYKTCALIPNNEKFTRIAEPFRKYDSSKLRCLANLPFEAIITTNCEKSLHDAWVSENRRLPFCAELGDGTLTAALFRHEFYLARIHGRVELPESMVLDTDDYVRLQRDDAYIDLLKDLFTRRSCLFVGFSFLDPAIRAVLETVKAKMGAFPQMHHALLPATATGLAERMAPFNIQVMYYDGADNHKVLWEAVDRVANELTDVSTAGAGRPTVPINTAKRFIAACYARAQMGKEVLPLTSVVLQGILLSLLDENGKNSATLAKQIREYLPLGEKEAEDLVSGILPSLLERDYCVEVKGKVCLPRKSGKLFDTSPVQDLAGAVANRLYVRYRYKLPAEHMAALLQVIEEVIVLRGWDLGASFAGANLDPDTDVLPTIAEAIKRNLPRAWLHRQEQIADAVFDLFRRPEPHEEKILADLGRIAFGVELVTQAGRSALYALSLPEDVFLDTNVVLPLIVAGHPYHRTYAAAIRKLREASSKSGVEARVLVTDSFLNELVSNRRIAMDLVRELYLEDEERLRRHILFFGADRVNVFVGAYASHVAKGQDVRLPFDDFLDSVAPYANEREAEEFLEAQGMAVVSSQPRTPKDQTALNQISTKLEAAYDAKAATNASYYKPIILIKHEARQLALLAASREAGRRSYLVTADKKLRAIVAEEAFTGLRDALMSHMGFVQLIDLLVGIGVEPSSLARVFWSVRAIDEEGVLRNYILDLALKKYDAALLLDMGEVLDRTIREATKNATLEDVILMPSDMKDEDAGKTTRFLDRVEDSFFSEMAREMNRREEEKK